MEQEKDVGSREAAQRAGNWLDAKRHDGDAVLAECPSAERGAYRHLSAFAYPQALAGACSQSAPGPYHLPSDSLLDSSLTRA